MNSWEPRFFQKVDKSGAGGCWLWTGYTKLGGGYGRFFLDGKSKLAHRLSYSMVNGSIPEGLQIDHLCRVRSCVNPRHLEAVSERVNLMRGIGPTAINARKTKCSRGHGYTQENTVINKNGARECRVCRKARFNSNYSRNRASIRARQNARYARKKLEAI